jgi:hypothetical protein
MKKLPIAGKLPTVREAGDLFEKLPIDRKPADSVLSYFEPAAAEAM